MVRLTRALTECLLCGVSRLSVALPYAGGKPSGTAATHVIFAGDASKPAHPRRGLGAPVVSVLLWLEWMRVVPVEFIAPQITAMTAKRTRKRGATCAAICGMAA